MTNIQCVKVIKLCSKYFFLKSVILNKGFTFILSLPPLPFLSLPHTQFHSLALSFSPLSPVLSAGIVGVVI